MDKPMSNFHFRLMSFGFRFRDFFLPPENFLKEAGIRQGFYILDYGCGPGSYSIAAAELVGTSGKVYALDIHPLAVQHVQKIASKRRLTNVETIHSACATGLSSSSIDVALLYDTLNHLSDVNGVLEELYRVLKPDGILSLSDPHMREGKIMSKVAGSGLFRLARKGKRTYSFLKERLERDFDK